MRVVIDGRCLMEAEGSGVTRYTRDMLSAIGRSKRSQDMKWTVLTSGKVKPNIALSLPAEQRHIRLPNTLMNFTISFLHWPPAAKFLSADDILWQPNPLFFPPFSGRSFVTIHDLSFLHYPEFFHWHTRSWYLAWVRSWLKRAPTQCTLVAVSEHTRHDILEQFPQWQGRVIVQSQPPPELALPRDKPSGHLVIAIGTVELRKNMEALLTAFRLFAQKVSDAELVIIGKRSSRSYERWIKTMLPPRARLLGYVSEQEMQQLINRAWCAVYSSWYEGYGLPPLDAMARGVPVIASHESAVPEVVRDAALLIDPFRGVEEIAVALESLASDEQLWNTYGERGKQRIKELNANYSLQPLMDVWQGRS